jgi:LuxR family transcriptional regulator, quorum-sensing system regulator LasR
MFRYEMGAALLDAADSDTWFDELSEIGRRHDFEYTIFALSIRNTMPFESAFYRGNHSAVWRKIYEQKHYVRIDPIVRYCQSKLTPLVWGSERFVEPEEQILYEQASGFGMRWGVTFPIHGPKQEVGMLCFATSRKSEEARRDVVVHMPKLGLIRDIAYETGLRFAREGMSSSVPKLTPCETECLKWLALGKSTWEISKILDRSQATINYHIHNIKRKMDVHSRSAAMMMAVKLGLIEVDRLASTPCFA